MSEPGPNYSGSGLPPCATNSKRDCIGHRAALARSAVEVRGLGSRVCALPPRPLPDVRILSNHESDSRGAVPSTDDPASAVGSVRRRRASLPPHIESLQAAGRRCWRPRREGEVSISPELTSRSPVDAACHDAVVTFQSALTLHGEVNVPIRNLSRPMRVGRPTRRARAPRPARFGLTRTVPCRRSHAGSFSVGWRRSLAFHSALDPRLWMYCRGGRTLAILRSRPTRRIGRFSRLPRRRLSRLWRTVSSRPTRQRPGARMRAAPRSWIGTLRGPMARDGDSM